MKKKKQFTLLCVVKVKHFTLFIYFAFTDRYVISISRNSSATLVNLCFLFINIFLQNYHYQHSHQIYSVPVMHSMRLIWTFIQNFMPLAFNVIHTIHTIIVLKYIHSHEFITTRIFIRL